MDLGLKGRVALVCGGTRGIGFAAALGFAREGATVAVCGRDPAQLHQARAALAQTGATVVAEAADLSRPADIRRLVECVAGALGRIDILVNNAAGPQPGYFEGLDDSAWESAFRVTLMSAVRTTRAVLPHMRPQKWGRIVNIASYSIKQPIGELLLSNSIRLAALGWAKTIAGQLAPDGILVNTVCPGWTATERLREVVNARAAQAGASPDEIASRIATGIPLGRFGTPEEVANLIVFLGSERASYLTGTAIQVDGGVVQSVF